MKDMYGVDRVHVVSHSKGGVDTRQYLKTSVQGVKPNDIETFVMLGTPNGGAEAATKLRAIFVRGLFLGRVAEWFAGTKNLFIKELTPEKMRRFNMRDWAASNARYITYAGDYRIGSLYLPFLAGWEPNDLVVAVSSVHTLPASYWGQIVLSDDWDQGADALHWRLHDSQPIFDVLIDRLRPFPPGGSQRLFKNVTIVESGHEKKQS